MSRLLLVALAIGSLLFLAACGGGTGTVAAPTAPATAAVSQTAEDTAAPAATATPAPIMANDSTGQAATATTVPATAAPAASTGASSASTGSLRLQIVPAGTEARYRVREQLVGRDLPSDAIGKTGEVTGTLTIGQDGTIAQGDSKFEIDLRTLKSDEGRRDRFIQGNTLQTGQFPLAIFVPGSATGLPSPLPSSGDVTFQLTGELTVHGVAHTVTWDVKGHIQGQDLTGTATTQVKFGDFGMNPPRVGPVLSVEDKIILELDFHLAAS